MKSNITTPAEVPYLRPLIELAHPPTNMYYSGILPPERSATVAIVGTRRPTSYGKEVTYDLAYKLARKGVVIVSGLAFGIDAIAHRGALDAGGTTIAVLANGLDTIYPSSHTSLAKEIIKRGGAIVSEYGPAVKARQFQFLARNRIVSGLSDAVVVTEAAERSGTLSTVNHALDQNKEIFAVPGNITSVLSVGPNRLLSQGAHPALSADDILAIVAPQLIEAHPELVLGDTPIETKLLQLLQSGVRDGDQLQQQLNITASDFSTALTMLEVHGYIRSLGANQWTLI
ncbi:MAG: protecting protein DprA [Candidatus Saccharibacteria bacterium]|nr:protecting protein DprA [Candidatus Saccharibacteria bacterium]